MKRINIYCHDRVSYQGWFDKDTSKELCAYEDNSGAYVNGRVLFRTASGRLVINFWNNSGKDLYRFPIEDCEIAEILTRGGYAGDDQELLDILAKFEV